MSNFRDIIGNEQIIKSMQSAIANAMVSHAYITVSYTHLLPMTMQRTPVQKKIQTKQKQSYLKPNNVFSYPLFFLFVFPLFFSFEYPVKFFGLR